MKNKAYLIHPSFTCVLCLYRWSKKHVALLFDSDKGRDYSFSLGALFFFENVPCTASPSEFLFAITQRTLKKRFGEQKTPKDVSYDQGRLESSSDVSRRQSGGAALRCCSCR